MSFNITAINPWFMLVFLGTAAACIFLTTLLLKWHQSGVIYLLVGSLYLVGTVGVTIVFNVPLNNALAIVKPVVLKAQIYGRNT